MLRIQKILESKIVPSLVIDPDVILPESKLATASDAQADALVALALQGREFEARAELNQLHAEGMGFEQIHLGLLAPAAEKLGVLWEDDNVSFVDVTIAMGTLQRLMYFTSLDLNTLSRTSDNRRSILIFPEPGAQHNFGARMAAEFFKHAGWSVDFAPDPDINELIAMVTRRHFDVIGLSIARAQVVPEAGRLIRRMKSRSINRNLVAIAGGKVIASDPTLIEALGADAAIVAMQRGVEQTEALLRAD